MMTVPQEWQLAHITHCFPGIRPQGKGVQKVVTGVQVAHMREAVEGGRKEVSLALARKELKKRLSSGQKWFLRPYFPLIRGMFENFSERK